MIAAWAGLVALIGVGVTVVSTGLPAAIVLVMAAGLAGLVGIISGAVPPSLVLALPGQLIGLLESDLLQAIPLYVLTGALINRLPIAEALFQASLAILPKRSSAPAIAGFGLGALLGPINGSVGASALALSRVLTPRLASAGIEPPQRMAITIVASTLGVLVPPSLVLILLGQAMLSAHTVAITATGRQARAINTQDIFYGALLPALIFFISCLVIAWVCNRFRTDERTLPLEQSPRSSRPQTFMALLVVIIIVALLFGVAAGYFYPVEAAAGIALLLLGTGFASGALTLSGLNDLLQEVMAITGSLFFLLLGATSLTFMLRLLGTDRLVGAWIGALPGDGTLVIAVVLAALWLSALVLDAFEILFAILPIVLPPLLMRVEDAQWVAVLVLLALQASFLDPFIGYAGMVTRASSGDRVPALALVKAMLPYILAQWALTIAVLLIPALVHFGAPYQSPPRPGPATEGDVGRMLEALPPLPPAAERPD